MKRKNIAITSIIIVITILIIGVLKVSAEPGTVEIRVSYSGSWSGCYGDVSHTVSVDGRGTRSFYLTNPDIVSAVFQKMDDGYGTLTVEIITDGKVVKRASTSAQYGVVSVSHTFGFGYGGFDFFSGICIMSLILGIIGIVAYFVIKNLESKKLLETSQSYPSLKFKMMSEGELYCSKCGFGNKESSKFCKKCGTKLG